MHTWKKKMGSSLTLSHFIFIADKGLLERQNMMSINWDKASLCMALPTDVQLGFLGFWGSKATAPLNVYY